MTTHRGLILILLIVTIVLTGCIDTTQPPTPESTITATDSPTLTATSPTGTNTPPPTEVASGPDEGTEWTVTIMRVRDGDTMEAEFPNGEIDTLRLLGVDTPETTLSRVNPDEFEGIPDTAVGRDHMFNWGERATDFTTNELAGKEAVVRVDPLADRRGSFGRLLVYILIDGENFNQRLLAEGYARVYPGSFELREEFEAAEATAQQNNVGLWDYTEPTQTPTETSSGGQLIVADVHADAEGNDHENLNDEYIVFENTGGSVLDLSGWTVADDADHIYTFPTGFELEPGASVTLYSGSGSDSSSSVYWGSGSAIWNNGGDTIRVWDASGSLVIEHEY